jgi:hypothetical protein
MTVAGTILFKRMKEFQKELAARGTTIEEELVRLEANGQILGTTSTKPLLHQTASINSR